MSHVPAPIVVGIDDTSASRAALRFALQEARRRGSAVDIVTAWSVHPSADLPMPADAWEWARARAQEIQDEAVAAVLNNHDEPATMTRQIIEGDAAHVLLQASRFADYLVVGSSRKGVMRHMLLGSISAQCVRLACCPVVVVPAPTDDADSDALGIFQPA